ncbi:hypothetical protein DB313_06290 (plasmid) [Borrelia turcica IST7]|uniref:Uncharacterized protein n=1 Tax=Borrelia turcica IST7 TaxID=1104446 RepID=A0A386PQP4_9SPIR|nr:DUF1357 family protein [Borrelia turcica]AYE37109.1 hypothetical protein DB313_06290 [Borrelia turcica IST7]
MSKADKTNKSVATLNDAGKKTSLVNSNTKPNLKQHKSISLDEYSQYMRYKKQQQQTNNKNSTQSPTVSINERIARELKANKTKVSAERSLLAQANKINEIDNLSKSYLSAHFNKETLLDKGYSLADIMLAQKKELIRKYVPSEQILAISKTSNIEHVGGEVLEQLVALAKVNIKRRDATSRLASGARIGKKGNLIEFKEQLSLNNPNFRPRNFSEFYEGIANTHKERRLLFYKNKMLAQRRA